MLFPNQKQEESLEDFPDNTRCLNKSRNAGKSLSLFRIGEPAASFIRIPKRPPMSPCQHRWAVLSKVPLEIRQPRLTLPLKRLQSLKYRYTLEYYSLQNKGHRSDLHIPKMPILDLHSHKTLQALMLPSVAHIPAHQHREFLSFLRVLGIQQNAMSEFSLYYIPIKLLANFSFHYLRKTQQG